MSVVAARDTSKRTMVGQMRERGKLVAIVDHAGGVFLRAVDVEQLAGIPPWSTGMTLFNDEWTVIDGHQFYPLQVAIARCEASSLTTAIRFLDWLAEPVKSFV